LVLYRREAESATRGIERRAESARRSPSLRSESTRRSLLATIESAWCSAALEMESARICDRISSCLSRFADRIVYLRPEITLLEIVGDIVGQEQRDADVAGLEDGMAEILISGGGVSALQTGKDPTGQRAHSGVDVAAMLVIEIRRQPAPFQAAGQNRIAKLHLQLD
jgi:hypothetical protein